MSMTRSEAIKIFKDVYNTDEYTEAEREKHF